MRTSSSPTQSDTLFVAVGTALRHADPVGLLAIGAPASEYDPEVRTIVPRLSEAASVQDLEGILHEEFCRWFGESTAGPREIYWGSAKEIWDFLQLHAV